MQTTRGPGATLLTRTTKTTTVIKSALQNQIQIDIEDEVYSL